MDEAPDFKDGYPSAGERIGPAWQAAWDALADRQWHKRNEITTVMTSSAPIVNHTAKNILRLAKTHNLIEQRGSRHVSIRRK